MLPRKPTGAMTPERQRLRDRASLLCDQRAKPPRRTDRTMSKAAHIFPRHPKLCGREFCQGCRRWLTAAYWKTEKGAEERRCDECMRASWRGYNAAARQQATLKRPNLPSGWGF